MGNRNERIEFIRVAKGIGIFLVVFGHAIVPEMRQTSASALQIYRFIYSFHMAFFMAISGYLFEINYDKYLGRGFKKFFISKFNTLIIPYLSFSVISYAGIGLAHQIPVLSQVLSRGGYGVAGPAEALFQIITHQNHIDKHLWFVYTLFFIFMAAFLSGPRLRYRGGVMIAVALYFLSCVFDFPYLLNAFCRNYVFFCLGRLTIPVNGIRRFNAWAAAGIFAASYVSRLIMPGGLHALFYAAANLAVAVCGSCFLISLSERLSVGKPARFIGFLGDYSYDVFLIHQPFITSGICGVLLYVTTLPYPAVSLTALIPGIAIPIFASKYIIRRVPLLNRALLGGHS